MIRIHDAYVSHGDSVYTPEVLFHPGETIRYNVVHSITPHEDARFTIYGLAERRHLNGVLNERLQLDLIWRPSRTFVVEGNYSHPRLLTTLSVGTIPADPDQAFLDSSAAVQDNRRRAVSDFIAGLHALEFTPGYWTFTAFLGLIDPAWPNDIIEFDVSYPFEYSITRP